jgi:glycosyltransferase involved in cell wall biosynthesis
MASRGHREVFTTSVDGAVDSVVPLQDPVDMDGSITYSGTIMRRLCRAMRCALHRRIGDFDIVHTHSVFLWPPWAAARAAHAANIPYVVSPRGMLVPELIRRKNRWVKNAWIALIERSTLQNAAAVHATSEVEAGHIAEFGWRLRPIVTIPHGVDDPENIDGKAVSPDVAAAVGSGPIVLALGRIGEGTDG